MPDGSIAGIRPLKGEVSAEEWQARVELAALYRLTALHGWDDLIYTHITARVPGPERHFLINPLGLLWEEITASSLVKLDLDGHKVSESEYGINYAGFVIHSAVHMAREDAHYVIHLHTDDGVAVSSQKDGLLPLNQRALAVIPTLAYHDYEGVALNLDERDRIVADLGGNETLLLRNHGTLSVGSTASKAWQAIFALERACTSQIRALTAGRDGVLIAPEAAQEEVRRQSAEMNRKPYRRDLVWEAMTRRLQREAPGYDS
jgi:ribulose-5-phosphate 4-epimerase/fuculose-1-phosphate aldolase